MMSQFGSEIGRREMAKNACTSQLRLRTAAVWGHRASAWELLPGPTADEMMMMMMYDVRFLWDFCGIPMDFYGIPVGVLWISMGFLGDSYGFL